MELKTTTRRRSTARGVLAIIERDGRILMEKRCEHVADPGTWVLPGGAIQFGEKPYETLVRVCGEELGIAVRPTKEIGTLTLSGEQYPVWQVLWKGQELALREKAIAGISWFTVDELLELTPVRHQDEFRTFLRSQAFFREEGLRREVSPEETKISEEQLLLLVKKAQDGDHDAFGAIYDQFATPIYRYVAFRVPEAIAEDLVADIFVKAWEKLHTYEGRQGTPFSSWLFRIARNLVIDTYRLHRDTEELDEFHEDGDRWNNPALSITQELQSTLLRQAMNHLPRRYREVLLLSFMSDLSNTEIAHSLRMREGSVRILKHRALKKLATLLPASMREELP